MTIIEDSKRSLVKLDKEKGIIEKTFVGDNAKERFENEVNILKHLKNKGFDNCPELLDSDPENFVVTQTYVGEKLGEIDIAEHRKIHNRLIAFGVTHNDSVINPYAFEPPIIDRLKTEKVETNEDGAYLVTYTAVTPNPQIINAPKNLVVDANGQINVIDFEFADLDE